MKVINEHIKTGEFLPVYLIYGDEKYLVKQFRNKLKKALLGEGDSMNLSEYEGKDINVKELIDVAETLPFFADRRVIVMENTGMFKSSQDIMAAYIREIPETTVIVFVEEEIDKRSKMYKTVKDVGYICEMEYQNEKILMRWVTEQFKERGKSIEYDALTLLLTKAGTQMSLLSAEVDKISSYVGERETITPKDVEEIAVTVVANKIFDMVEAIARKKQKQALDMYYDLLVLKEAPMRILFLISRHFNLLMQIKEMSQRNVDSATLSKTVSLPSFVINKYKDQGKAFSIKQLKRALMDCADVEERVKVGNLNDQMAVELIIIKYSN